MTSHREAKQKTERLGVLQGLLKYAPEHVLLVGRPGSGKSTALARLLLEEATSKREEQKIPVLVRLRNYKTSVLDLIRSFLKEHALVLERAEIEGLLCEQRFLLLVDGLNELPSEEARRDLMAFRRENAATPMIFTTRDLGVGGDLNIAKKLEMQPLTEVQMREFVRKYIPEQGEQMLRQLGNRLQEFGQTPLLLWMLCSVFKVTGKVPPNLGLVLRKFTQLYDRQLKQDATVTEQSRQWWPRLLQNLAFKMSQGQSPKELRVAIAKPEVEEFLTNFLQNKVAHPDDCALSWLKDLLNHHLIRLGADEQIEFQHQLIQEYYTAESLLKQLPQLSDDSLKREYLNYLKWTEPLALMLELVDNEAQAQRVVRLALEVDLRLAARLAGAVKPKFQEETIALVAEREIPQRVKIELLGITHSDRAIPTLLETLKDEDSDVRSMAADALGEIGNEAAVPALLEALKDENSFVRSRAAVALGKIASSELLPRLSDLALTTEEVYLFNTIAAIQERCKYYNHTLISPEIISSTMYILHLSDLHFGTIENANNWYSQLADDLSQELELDCPRLDALILSGDIANKSTPEEYTAAKQFLENLCQNFQLRTEQIVIVPGNHDLNWKISEEEGYKPVLRKTYQGSMDESCVIDDGGTYIAVLDPEQYKRRFENFSNFYKAIKGKEYPINYEQQYTLDRINNLLILGLNSAWQLDHYYKSRASINQQALSNALDEIRHNPEYQNCRKIAVWHHPLNSAFEDRIKESNFLERLVVNGFRLFLHGHVHQAQKGFFEYDAERGLYRICAGTFGAPTRELPTATAWQYHMLKFEGDTLTVQSRKRQSETGAWESDPCWRQGKGKPPSDHYEIPLLQNNA